MQQLCVCEVKLCTHELLTTYGLKGRFVDFQSPCLFSKTLQALKTRTRRNPGPAGTLNQQESWTSRNPRPAGTLNQQEPWTCRNPRPAGTLNQQESWTSRNHGPAGNLDLQEPWNSRNCGWGGSLIMSCQPLLWRDDRAASHWECWGRLHHPSRHRSHAASVLPPWTSTPGCTTRTHHAK